ncbi:hypothetical protein [Xanthocytophaga agilis]|uniref:Uncharacterized protein n=1 Tax=Xanthocytophaga agilis TaxID=3048010 RepID=A0AAE3UEC0_9BACT|nr:hypothetical protein [Xanthocytophaga agilis]MDJ1502065.1 hypothetical protein [Xanthocytophaga agilis]
MGQRCVCPERHRSGSFQALSTSRFPERFPWFLPPGWMALLWVSCLVSVLIRAGWLRMEVLAYISLPELKPVNEYGYGIHYFRFEEWGAAGMLLTALLISVFYRKNKTTNCK